MIKFNSKRGLAAGSALLGVVGIVASALVVGSSAGATTTPPWVGQDANAVGGLAFFNSSGAQITGGKLTDSPLAAYVVGTTALRAGDTVATLYGFLPDPNKLQGLFSGEQLSGTTVYPASGAPSPVGSTALPVVSGAAGDETLQILDGDYPQNSTATGYVNTFELRLKTSAPGKTNTITYDYADITINPSANTWTLTYTPPSSFPGGGATATTTSIGLDPMSAVTGASVMLSSTVSPSTATGTIQFKDGASTIGSPVTVSGGSASLSTSFTTTGPHLISAVFTPADSTKFSASTSPTVTENITAPATTTTTAVTATPSSVETGASVSLGATVTPSTAAGTIQFKVGSTAIGSPVAVSGGTASATTSFSTTGSKSITAVFTPTDSSVYTASTSPATTVTVTAPASGATTTTTTVSATPSAALTGATVDLSAAVTPADAVGSVQFMDGTSAIGSPVTVAGGSASGSTSFSTPGAHQITAVFTPTDPTAFTASTSASTTVTISAPAVSTTTALTATPASVQTGASVALDATVTPADAVGTVQFEDGTTAIGAPVTVSGGAASATTSFTTTGDHSVTAVFTPSDPTAFTASTSAAATVNVTAPVSGATTTTTALTASPMSVVPDSTVSLTATLSPSDAVGAVQFEDGSTPIGSPVPVSGGTATTSTTFPTVAEHQITAVFTPTDPTAFTASTSSPVTVDVTSAATATTTNLTADPMSSAPGDTVTLTATLSPSTAAGSVQFEDGSSPIGSPVTVVDGIATTTTSFSSPGQHELSAVFTPDDATAYSGSTGLATETITSSGGGSSGPSSGSSSPSGGGSSSTASSSGSPSSSSSAPASSASSTASATGATSSASVAATNSAGTLAGNPTLTPGETVTLVITGLTPGGVYDVTVHSVPIDLGDVTADSTGTITYPFTVPATLGSGTHTVEFTSTTSGQTASFAFQLAATAGTSETALASTGFDTRSLVDLGFVLVGIGAIMLAGTRRRVVARGRHSGR